MKAIAALIFFGWLGVFLFRTFRPRAAVKLGLLLLFSAGFLQYYAGFPSSLLVPAWAATAWLIGETVRRNPRLVPAYIGLVVCVFVAFKLGYFPYREKNPLLETAIPVGFSFLMFHSIAYLLDVSRGTLPQPVSLPKYAASALFFPTLAIGPFHKVQTFLQSLERPTSGRQIFHGYCLFCLGALKLAISGFLVKPQLLNGSIVRYIDHGHYHPFVLLLLGSVYLYANFSGYSDLAVGIARMMGFEIPMNFRFPFLACSMADFWRHWHITLGAWFREYVFLPLNYALLRRFPKLAPETLTSFSVFLVFFLIGLWHQLSWKLLVYSTLNALLVAYAFPENRNKRWGIPLTFLLVLFINGIFLAPNLHAFGYLLRSMLLFPEHQELSRNLLVSAFCFALLAVFYLSERVVARIGRDESSPWPLVLNFALSIAALFLAVTLGIGRADPVYVGY